MVSYNNPLTLPHTAYCNYSYPSEITCVPMAVGKNCSDPNPHTFYVHFTAPNVLDIAGKLQSCIHKYIEECNQRGCQYCWDPIHTELPYDFSNNAGFSHQSYEHFKREWKIIIRDASFEITTHTVFIIEGYAKSMINYCEKSLSEEHYKLYAGIALGGISLLYGGWIAYCKYKDYQFAHLLDRKT